MTAKLSRRFWLVFVTIMLVPFQNCSQANFKSNSIESQNTTPGQVPENQQNGTGYGGKTYTNYLIGSNSCSDGSAIFGHFTTVDANTAILERDNCQSIAPQSISLTALAPSYYYSIKIENPYDLYVFRRSIWETLQPATPLIPTRITHVCWGNTWSTNHPAKVVVSQTTVGAPTVTATATVEIAGVKSEYLMRNLISVPTAPGSKKVQGNDGTASYYFMNQDAFPHWGSAGYNSASENFVIDFECIHNF